MLLSADGVGTVEILRRTGKSKTCVWRWQERFAAEGYDGPLRDKTRPSRIAPLRPRGRRACGGADACRSSGRDHHWTANMMAAEVGVSASAVRRIWKAHGLQPQLWRAFKLSNDPPFVAKLKDVVGLYIDRSAHAIVLSVHERSQIRRSTAPSPTCPKEGPARHHDPRLQAAWHDHIVCPLNVLDGTVIGRNMQRHRHQEVIRFPNAINARSSRDPSGHLDGDIDRLGGRPPAAFV